METIEALIHRRSCRNYSDRTVEAEKLARIIEAGQYAPSGMGRQPVTLSPSPTPRPSSASRSSTPRSWAATAIPSMAPRPLS